MTTAKFSVNAIISLFLILIFNTYLFSQTVTPQPTETPTVTTTPSPSPSLSEEVITLRAQNEMLKKYNDGLQSDIRWAIGIMVGLLAIGWIVNYKISDREFGAIKEQLTNNQNSTFNALKAEIENKSKEQIDLLKQQSLEYKNTLSTGQKM